MLNNFRNLQSLFWSHGIHWLMFRVGYALRKRTGFIRRQMPRYDLKDRPLGSWLKKQIPSTPEDYAVWRHQNSPKFFFNPLRAERSRSDSEGAVEAQIPNDTLWNPQIAIDEAERILNGELKYFAHQFLKTGFPPDWHKDPVSGIQLDSSKHWSEISDDGSVDIKFIWEPSRFGMIYTLVRAYASTRDEKYVEAFWKLIQSWAEANPPNTGPNWMDGQEAALRLMAWTFGFYAFMDSASSTSARIAQFTVLVGAHAERIYKNIDYAISTHSNHTVSEASGLWLVGLLFPELKGSEKYFALGRKLLVQEAAAQIFPDGSYSMHSLNYHRFILQIYLCAMRLGELNSFPFSESLKQRVTRSVDYLYQLIDPETGQMPVYGSNDGALVLPLNNCDFTDFRPLLQLGSYLTRGQRLFESGAWDEPLYWLCGPQALQSKVESPPQTSQSYADGGVSVLRGSQSKAVIRCTDFRSRPSHADQLHVDLWWRDKNIACDAGTYLYSGEGAWRNGLAHTAVHNTVTVDHKDQMKMVSRFTWTNWSRGKVLKHGENLWQGEHNGYKPVPHKRAVMALDGDRWLVVDQLQDTQPHHYALHWLLNDFPYEQQENLILLSLDSMKYKVQVGLVEGKSVFSVVRRDPKSTRGWRSRYYGDKEPVISAMLETDQPRVCFWTFFGIESDQVELAGNNLEIGFDETKVPINLQHLHRT
jgi:Heparinase II/III-like protein/Heparinase II/III N-terminus